MVKLPKLMQENCNNLEYVGNIAALDLLNEEEEKAVHYIIQGMLLSKSLSQDKDSTQAS